MSDKAHKGILDRAQAEDLGKQITEPLDSLRDLVDYGTNLVLRCYHTSGKSLKDIVALFSLFQGALSMTDAIEVLMRQGVVRPGLLQLRSLFEVSVTLQWVLRESGDKRARAYHVANLRKQRLWTSRQIPGSDENKHFQSFHQTVGQPTLSPARERELRTQVAELDRALSSQALRDLNMKFDAFYKKRKFEQTWHIVVGMSSFRAIADEIGRSAEYSFIYAGGSEVMHGSTYSGQVAFEGRDVVTDPLRSSRDAEYLLATTMTLTLEMLRSTLEHYRPDELENLSRKYIQDWKYPLRRIPPIRVQPTILTLDR